MREQNSMSSDGKVCVYFREMSRNEDDGDMSVQAAGETLFPGRKPGFGVRPVGFVESSDDESDTSVSRDVGGSNGGKGSGGGNGDDVDKGSSSSLSLLPVFPDNLNWNEARERWVVWKPLFVRLLELRRNIKSQRDKETILIARGGNLIQDIAFAQRPAPGETDQAGEDGEVPVFDNLLKRCDYYFTANSHVAIDIERFRGLKQKADEPFTTFVNRLRRLANLCSFGADAEREIKMQILSGAVDRKLLIQQGVMYDKSLAELETYGMRLEMSRDLFASAEGGGKPKEEVKTEEVGAVREGQRAWKRNTFDSGRSGSSYQGGARTYQNNARSYQGYQGNRQSSGGAKYDRAGSGFGSGGGKKTCARCATTHKFGACPASGKECFRCGRPGHFAAACGKQERVGAIGDRFQPDEVSQVKIDDDWD